MSYDPDYIEKGHKLIGRMDDCIGMLDFDRACRIVTLLSSCAYVPGDMVEFGCHAGHTSLLMTSVSMKRLWCYDSFEGLPDKTEKDGDCPHEKGEHRVSSGDFLRTFARAGVPPPILNIKWFEQLTQGRDDLPSSIAFAHIDCDFYSSIMTALQLVYPRLSQGAVCIVDDYGHPEWPGVKKAVDDFIADKPEFVIRPFGMDGRGSLHCFFTKL